MDATILDAAEHATILVLERGTSLRDSKYQSSLAQLFGPELSRSTHEPIASTVRRVGTGQQHELYQEGLSLTPDKKRAPLRLCK
jgi:hypothetical protein